MSYTSLRQAVRDLQRTKQLIVLDDELDPDLEMAAIHRRVFAAGGPALFFQRVKGSAFPAVSNLFGSLQRARFLLRHGYQFVEALIGGKANPATLANPLLALRAMRGAYHALPRPALRSPGLAAVTELSHLPQIRAWKEDGGPYIFLPQVLSYAPGQASLLSSNLGMYRVQIAGNDFAKEKQMGLHYQIHRGIGIHQTEWIATGKAMPVSIFVGGPPAHTLAAIMPLPEGLPEIAFAGALAARSFRYRKEGAHFLSADADFCITGQVQGSDTLPEGPFGDHLGYYSLKHDYPVFCVDKVYHRKDAIWPFTIVGRPPQEDTIFGKIIHELTAPMAPKVLPGVRALHAIDAAGVHPLLLAIGSERYAPFSARRPMELNTIACAILGFGQASLAKYLLLAAGEDRPPDLHDIPAFFQHVLERINLKRDLHFHTSTTIDTLDYSGQALNSGSKLVAVAAGAPVRKLLHKLPADFILEKSALILPGVLLVQGASFVDYTKAESECLTLANRIAEAQKEIAEKIALAVLVDDLEFCRQSLNNFLWVTFTRSNPSHDVHGAFATIHAKHWSCLEPLLIDARARPQHAPPLEEDSAVLKKIERLFRKGAPLAGY